MTVSKIQDIPSIQVNLLDLKELSRLLEIFQIVCPSKWTYLEAQTCCFEVIHQACCSRQEETIRKIGKTVLKIENEKGKSIPLHCLMQNDAETFHWIASREIFSRKGAQSVLSCFLEETF